MATSISLRCTAPSSSNDVLDCGPPPRATHATAPPTTEISLVCGHSPLRASCRHSKFGRFPNRRKQEGCRESDLHVNKLFKSSDSTPAESPGNPSHSSQYGRDRRADLRAAVGSRDFGGFRQATTQPTMGYILVDARMPYGDQSFIARAQQAGWNECHKIVGLQYL